MNDYLKYTNPIGDVFKKIKELKYMDLHTIQPQNQEKDKKTKIYIKERKNEISKNDL